MQNKFCEACYPRPEGRGITAYPGKSNDKDESNSTVKEEDVIDADFTEKT